MRTKMNVNVIAAMILVILIAVMSGCSQNGGTWGTPPWNEKEVQKMKDDVQTKEELSPVKKPKVSPITIYSF